MGSHRWRLRGPSMAAGHGQIDLEQVGSVSDRSLPSLARDTGTGPVVQFCRLWYRRAFGTMGRGWIAAVEDFGRTREVIVP